MASGAVWVDEFCRSLDIRRVSAWLPWNVREKGEALGGSDEPEGAAGVYLIGRGDEPADIEVVYIDATGGARVRLGRLEDQVKWGMNQGFGTLRELLEHEDDHRTMRGIRVKMIRVEEIALFHSPLLTPRRLNALGAARSQLKTMLLAEHYRRFGVPVPGNRAAQGLFLRDAPTVRAMDRSSLVAA
jgi:hypothetical protein